MAPASDFDYKKYLQLIVNKKYLYVIFALVIMTGTVVVSYLLPAKYEAKSTIFIEKSVISDLVKGIAVTPSLEDKIKVLTYAMKSRTLLLKVLNDLDQNLTKNSDAHQEALVNDFQKRTDIKLKDKEGLFIITFYDENPRLARDYVNGLVRHYIEENISSKRDESYGASKFLAEQIEPVKQKLEEIDARQNSFKRANANILGENEQTILSDISIAQGKLDEITIKRNQLQSIRDLNKVNTPLKAKFDELNKRLHELSIVYTDNYPEVIEMKNQLAVVKEQMKTGQGVNEVPLEEEKIRMEISMLKQNELNLRRYITSKRGLLQSIPAAKSSLEEMEREKESQKILYNQLMTRHGQSEVSKQMEVQDKTTNFRIVDPAVIPVKPSSPNRVVIILLGILAGLAGSLAILVLLDYLDSTVRNLDTLKSLGVPVLAVVPKIQNPADLKAARITDIRFFTVAAAYFSIILAVLSIEVIREFSIDFMNIAQIKQELSQLTSRFLN